MTSRMERDFMRSATAMEDVDDGSVEEGGKAGITASDRGFVDVR